MATMPTVTGMLLETAENSLLKAGVLVPRLLQQFGTWPIKAIWRPRGNGVAGFVTAQSPSSGTTVASNAAVTLTVNEYPLGVAYPATNWSAF